MVETAVESLLAEDQISISRIFCILDNQVGSSGTHQLERDWERVSGAKNKWRWTWPTFWKSTMKSDRPFLLATRR
jgi:hypothetical protein